MIIRAEGRQFIHYGSNNYDPEKFNRVKNFDSKPKGGLWACDINTRFGWKEWCLAEGFCGKDSPRINDHFYFALKKDAKILQLKDPEDFDLLPIRQEEYRQEAANLTSEYVRYITRFNYINWEVIRDIGIDAVEYIRTPFGHDVFYTWDFDSIVILNHNAIASVT